MCGIFGQISTRKISYKNILILAKHSEQRGIDSSGFVNFGNGEYQINRADYKISKLLTKIYFKNSSFVMGHSRLVTNGMADNQPVIRKEMFVIHNGIIVNHEELWNKISIKRELEIDTEIILGLAKEYLLKNDDLRNLPNYIFDKCKGTVSAVLAIPSLGKILLFSNNGSLYIGKKSDSTYFSSEKYSLNTIKCNVIEQVRKDSPQIYDIPKATSFKIKDYKIKRLNLIPKSDQILNEENLLQFEVPSLKRCSKCILPETFPFITFDDLGVCNYCKNYKIKDKQKSKNKFISELEKYRVNGEINCLVPFSGGRDSCFALHIIVNELKLKPITYTYDWGMVTDLARRNISRFCSQLGVENIIVSANIKQKRENIKVNLKTWLKKPNLGMVSILTAGDKHFFKYIENIKKQTGIKLNIWGTNPLETTHFKAGFLGIKPDFNEKKVYTSNLQKQFNYQFKRFLAMLKNPGYFNLSLFDTLSGEYYRSFLKKNDYFHLYDFFRWEENEVNKVLAQYDFEKAPDTNTTWRIGDGTAAFYNYIYYTVAGFTEHDTFRSNQIREGHISRDEALRLVLDENKPRYLNLKWYLDTLGMDFVTTVKTINKIPKLFK